ALERRAREDLGDSVAVHVAGAGQRRSELTPGLAVAPGRVGYQRRASEEEPALAVPARRADHEVVPPVAVHVAGACDRGPGVFARAPAMGRGRAGGRWGGAAKVDRDAPPVAVHAGSAHREIVNAVAVQVAGVRERGAVLVGFELSSQDEVGPRVRPGTA